MKKHNKIIENDLVFIILKYILGFKVVDEGL
jgi:hypothetical protein